ncbi:MAG: NfeD family protein [Rhodocyclaceae bacterium]
MRHASQRPPQPGIAQRLLAAWLVLLGVALLGGSFAGEQAAPGKVVALRLDGAIGPASADFIVRGLTRAAEGGAGLAVIELDTPGGLDTSMRVIIKHILASPIPVVTYVYPEGARAASAGTFILYASHVAAMAPATNLGAASPVAIGAPGGNPAPGAADDGADRTAADGQADPKDSPDATGDTPSSTRDTSSALGNDSADATPATPAVPRGSGRSSGSALMDKATNDAAAYIRSLAQLRGRDADFAERAVREAASLSAHEALQAGVIDIVATNLTDLLTQLDGREIRLDSGNTLRLATAGAQVEQVSPDWRTSVLALISNPQLALVLMMIGIYGLFFEFTSPGFGVPGVAGLICILVAMYAFQLLPVNWAGVALIAVGAVLMLAEAFLPSFGVLGIGGIVAFVVGGLFLLDGDVPGFGIPTSFVVAMAVLSAGLLFAVGTFAVRARGRRVVSGREDLIAATGAVTAITGDTAYAHIHGEQWRVIADTPLATGDMVRVRDVDGLTLRVERLPQPTQSPRAGTTAQYGNTQREDTP